MNPLLSDIFARTRAIDKSKISDSAGLTPTQWDEEMFNKYRAKAMVLTAPTREVRAKLAMNFLNTLVSPTGSLSEIVSKMVYCLRDPQGEKGTYEYALDGMFGGGSNIEDPGKTEQIKDVSKEYITVKIEDSSDSKAYKKLHPDTAESLSTADEMESMYKELWELLNSDDDDAEIDKAMGYLAYYAAHLVRAIAKDIFNIVALMNERKLSKEIQSVLS